MHAGATTPAESLGAVAISPNGNGLPRYQGGSASALSVSGPAQRSLHVPACMFAESPEVTRYTRVLQRIRYLLRRSGCFRPSDRLAGWDLHPLEIADFHGVPDKLEYVRLIQRALLLRIAVNSGGTEHRATVSEVAEWTLRGSDCVVSQDSGRLVSTNGQGGPRWLPASNIAGLFHGGECPRV